MISVWFVKVMAFSILSSEKGNRQITREPRQWGSMALTAGIIKDHIAVIVTSDRVIDQAIKVTSRVRIIRKDVEKALDRKIRKDTVFYTDAHRSFSAFANARKALENVCYAGNR